jgi:hypothetical protein
VTRFTGTARSVEPARSTDLARPAYRQGVPTEPETVDEVLEECASAYGRDLLAYLLGAGDGTPLASFRLSSAADKARDRLRVCYRVLRAINEPRRARAWMRHASAALGGRTPAWAVRNGDRRLLALVEREAAHYA